MICVYVLISLKDNNRYIGSTDDLQRRLEQHSKGLVISTKNRRPLKLIYYHELNSLDEARVWESKYKRSRGTYNKMIQLGILKRGGV